MQRIKIVAELSCNHIQDFEIAYKTLYQMKWAGADYVKFQLYKPETITINCSNKYFKINSGLWKGKTLYQLYQKAFTPWEWMPKLIKYCNRIGLKWFATPFDKTAVDYLEKLKCPMYKISSFEITDIPLIKHAAKTKKPIIFSSGIASMSDINKAVRTARMYTEDITVLKCISSYPTNTADINLNSLKLIKNVKTGISDHSTSPIVPIVATAMGISMIEKHFIIDNNLNSEDTKFSLCPCEFRKMVIDIREAEKILGKQEFCVSKQAIYNKQKFSKSIFAVKDIEKDETFTFDNIKVIRPGYGMHPNNYELVLFRQAKANIKRGTPLRWEHVK